MKTISGVVGVIIIAVAAWLLLQPKQTPVAGTETTPVMEDAIVSPTTDSMESGTAANTVETAPGTEETTTFTMEEVAGHKTPEDCYTAIRGIVYNLTAFVNKHPGGDKNILKICGIDGTSAFEGKHGGQEKPETTLSGFEIGTIVQ